jgi:hypothetical protein
MYNIKLFPELFRSVETTQSKDEEPATSGEKESEKIAENVARYVLDVF